MGWWRADQNRQADAVSTMNSDSSTTRGQRLQALQKRINFLEQLLGELKRDFQAAQAAENHSIAAQPV